jgi:glycosyltransferase involved in cell wall biosynthesis
VKFIGHVPHAEVPKWLNSFHIYAALSVFDSESFGVSVVEASACGLPVVVSDAGGLPEVVLDGSTGYIVPKRDARAAAEKLLLLAADADLRDRMGREGRAYALKHYEWSENADRMERLYLETIHCRSAGCDR